MINNNFLESFHSYNKEDVAWFHSSKQQNWELHNMSAGFDFIINDIHFKTSEALFQALKFQDKTIQQYIADPKNPMQCKFRSRKYSKYVRFHNAEQWQEIQYQMMMWVTFVKLSFYSQKFAQALKATGKKEIVEISRKKSIWACKETEIDLLGQNAMGKILTATRNMMYENKGLVSFQIPIPANCDHIRINNRPLPILGENPLKEGTCLY